jgi:hypothetical protein
MISGYANDPGDLALACRLRGAVGAGDQGAIWSPQRDDVSVGRRCPLIEPSRWGLVQVPEDYLADLAARAPPLAARDAVFAAFLHRCTLLVHGSRSTVPERLLVEQQRT